MRPSRNGYASAGRPQRSAPYHRPMRASPRLLVLLAALAAACALPAAASAAPRPPCLTSGLGGTGWTHVDVVGVRLWARTRRQADVAAIRRLAPAAARSYGRFKALLGRTPPSDARARCRNGGDGRVDVYVTPGGRDGRGRALPAGTAAAYRPYSGEPCDPLKPGVIVARPTFVRWQLAHELYHAFREGFPRAQSCIHYLEWDEADATWAADSVYGDDQLEHAHRSGLTTPDLPLAVISGYAAWVFPYALSRWHGQQVIRRLEVAKGTRPADEHLETAIPGGFRKAWARFALAAWNQAPQPGTGGPSFAQWDRFAAHPTAKTYALDRFLRRDQPVSLPDGKLRIRSRAYVRLTVPRTVGAFAVLTRSGATGTVGAYIHVRGGAWRMEDWTGRPEVPFCAVDPREDVDEVIIALGNSAQKPPPIDLDLRVRVAAGCWPERIVGTFSGSDTFDDTGAHVTWSGTIGYRIAEGAVTTAVGYEGDGTGSMTWTVDGAANGCTFSGAGTLDGSLYEATLALTTAKEPGKGWKYGTQALATRPPGPYVNVMPYQMICPDSTTTEDASHLAAILYNGYATGNPESNRYTPDLVRFAGDSTTTPANQHWVWSLTGSGRVVR